MLLKPYSKDQKFVVFLTFLLCVIYANIYSWLLVGFFSFYFFNWKLTTNQRTIAILGWTLIFVLRKLYLLQYLGSLRRFLFWKRVNCSLNISTIFCLRSYILCANWNRTISWINYSINRALNLYQTEQLINLLMTLYHIPALQIN